MGTSSGFQGQNFVSCSNIGPGRSSRPGIRTSEPGQILSTCLINREYWALTVSEFSFGIYTKCGVYKVFGESFGLSCTELRFVLDFRGESPVKPIGL